MAVLEIAEQLVRQLADSGARVVFAESCTGGLVAAELAKVPGVSDHLCGSAVTYRCDTKVQWLGVSSEEIERHTAVSREVAIQMARGVLERTPEASLSASITGHLGPGAPPDLDGVAFIGIATKGSDPGLSVECSQHQLACTERLPRQSEAASLVLKRVLDKLVQLGNGPIQSR
jgi:nicotinamide-nucleotide amidase